MKKVSRFTFNRLLAASARFFSTVMSPLLMPTYGAFLVLWASVLCLLPSGTRVTVLVMVLGITCVLPMLAIGVLHHYGLIHDKQFTRRTDRLIPYAFGLLCYVGAAFYLRHIHSPQWFIMFIAGAGLSCLVSMLVNFKWKISAHSAGIGGVVALLFQLHVQGLSAFNLFWVICGTMLLAGVLGTSRLILKNHTVGQVLAGFANGYLCVMLMMKYLG
ncbi:MAG: hypothetical protein IJ808_09560 [Muribaculaceae bacterium]|nr:hypothetical protein [Muribaculaceae bacterium]